MAAGAGGVVDVLADVVLGFAMIVGPVLGYIPQIREIMASKRVEGFSDLVSFVLITCNTLRLFFWIGKRFSMVLVWQSIFMLVAQLVLLRVCVMHTPRPRRVAITDAGAVWSHFWRWSDFASYLIFVAALVGLLTLSTSLFIASDVYFELLGTLALLTESALGMPQVYKNYKTGTTAGLSLGLIGSWFLGDGFKAVMFLRDPTTPRQFLMCAVIQLTVDCIILAQMASSQGSSRLAPQRVLG